jgi:hypothetical protein
MKNKKLIYEVEPQQQNVAQPTNMVAAEQIKNKTLKLAFNNQCFFDYGFPKSAYTDESEKRKGQEGYYKKSDNPKLVDTPYVWIFPEENGTSFTWEYRKIPFGNPEKIRTGVTCAPLSKTIDPLLTPDQADVIEALKDNNFKTYTQVTPKEYQSYNLINIYNSPEVKQILGNSPPLLSKIQGNPDRTFWMWQGKGLTASLENKTEEGQRLVTMLVDKGWKLNKDIPKEEYMNYILIDLGKPEDYNKNKLLSNYRQDVKYFTPPFLIGVPKGSISLAEKNAIIQGEKALAKTNWDKKACRAVIIDWYEKYMAAKAGEVPDYADKQLVEGCLMNNRGSYPRLSDIISIITNVSTNKPQWQLDRNMNFYAKKVTREHEEKILKQTISESLSILANKKRKTLSESKIVRQRFQILAEGKNLNNRRDLHKVFHGFLIESAYMNSRGYNQRVIAEGFWDIIGGFFGGSGTGTESILSYFKEYAGKWLIKKFGIDPDGWIGSILITTIGNLKFGEIGKLTDCNYLVPLLSKSIAEGAVRKFMVSKEMDNAFSSIIRNAILELLEDSAFGQAIEKGLSKIICPLLGDLSTKMGNVTNTLKDKALGDGGKSLAQGIASQI